MPIKPNKVSIIGCLEEKNSKDIYFFVAIKTRHLYVFIQTCDSYIMVQFQETVIMLCRLIVYAF